MQQDDLNDANPLATRQTILERRAKMPLSERNPELAHKIKQMQLTIAPIIHVINGKPPPMFPKTMLQMFLLTEAQLDAMAAFYSQTNTPTSNAPSALASTDSLSSPPSLRLAYPWTMDWSRPCLSTDPTFPENCKFTDLERLKVKMRMFARFVGMRGAQTPTWEIRRHVEILANRIEWNVRGEAGARERGKIHWGGHASQS
ncbi:hypothetical protein K458DRAFT_419910 [Lentithecium fluviatile CBS 122367]|uniref:Uncharacterized protein n=1 Tax=Lentithecium fluviatile CBS 122367 TaxID=1168545 RepID=A0A6G1IW70_9PLEO|nr:hypothetical protein K458DRAFT_419910 [Lentithecium fluviatile CBS 122367]